MGEEWADPYADALRDQLVRAIDMRDLARAAALGREFERGEEKISSNDPRTVALVAETFRLGGGRAGAGDGSNAAPSPGAAASLSYLSRKSSLFPSSSSSDSFSCHPWILFVRAMAEPPGDLSCLPDAARAGFARSLEDARQRGWTLTAWSRAVTTGRP